MKLETLKIENLTKGYLQEIVGILGVVTSDLEERHNRLKGHEHLVYELLLKIHKRNNKDTQEGKKYYKLSMTKGEAFIFVQVFSKDNFQSPALSYVLPQLHQKLA